MSTRRLSVRLAIAVALVGVSSTAIAAGSYRKTDTGVIVTPAGGSEKVVRLQVYGDQIIRVTSSASGDLDLPPSFMVTAVPQARTFAVTEADGRVTLTTSKVRASVSLADGNVSFTDSSGQLDLAESGPGSFAPVTVEGKNFLATRQQFNRNTDEGLFGLGPAAERADEL